MIRRALRLTGRADLGLELGIRENLSHFGLPGIAMSAARTLHEAAGIALRYQDQTGGISRMSLEYGEDHVAVVVDSNLHDKSLLPFVIEEFFASSLALLRLLVGEHYNHFELPETLGNPYGLLGRAALDLMGLTAGVCR